MNTNDTTPRPELNAFDLSPVTRTLRSRGIKHPEPLEREFRRFLDLLLEYPSRQLRPPRGVERYWRECIVHTSLYRRLCDQLFGERLEFDPDLPSDTREERVQLARERYRERYGDPLPALWRDTLPGDEIPTHELLSYLAFSGELDSLRERLRNRKRGVNQARRDGIEVKLGELQDGANTFRRRHGLEDREETERWLEDHGVVLEQFEQFVEEELLLYKFQRGLARDAGLELEALEPEYEDAVTDLLFENWLSRRDA